MAQKKNHAIKMPPQLPLHLMGPKLASLLSDPPFSDASVPEFEKWIEAVECEPDKSVGMIASQAYVVYHEQYDPVSSRLYRLVGGTPPPGVHYYIGQIPIFIALAAASGVVGNLAYDILKRIVLPFLTPEGRITFEEKISFEEYETVRKESHQEDARTEPSAISRVEKEVGLKHRLLIERKWSRE